MTKEEQQNRKKVLLEDSEFLLKRGEWPGRIIERVDSTAYILETIWREAGNTEYANIFARQRPGYGKDPDLSKNRKNSCYEAPESQA